jgi:hypothetical protein
MQAPKTVKDLITGDIQALLKLDLIPWVYDIEDNLTFAGMYYADYFKPITVEELDAIGETPYLEYCDEAKRLKAEYTANLFTGIATEPYLLTLAKAYRQLATLNKFESLFTGLASAKPNSKQLKAGMDYGKKYAQHNALLMLANGCPMKLKELETMPVNYIYLTLDYQAEKSAAEARYLEQQKGA